MTILQEQGLLPQMVLTISNPAYVEAMLDFVYSGTYRTIKIGTDHNLHDASFHAKMRTTGQEFRVYGLPKLALRNFDQALSSLVEEDTFATSHHLIHFIQYIYMTAKIYPDDLRRHLLAFVRCELETLMANEDFVTKYETIEGFPTDLLKMTLQPEKTVYCVSKTCKRLKKHKEMGLKCQTCKKKV